MDSKTFVDELILSHEYDPIKRREYYLKTRQLKGRVAGGRTTSIGRSKSSVTTAVIGRSVKKTSSRKEIEARVKALQARLDKLRAVLADMVRQAQIRSGLKPKPKKSADSKSDTKKNTKQTAKQKADAAKRSKEYYNKNKTNGASQQIKELEAKIAAVQAKIKEMRAQLALAKKKAAKRKTGAGGVGRSISK